MKYFVLLFFLFIQPFSSCWADSDWLFFNIGIGGPEISSNGNGESNDIDFNLRAGFSINEYLDIGIDYYQLEDNIGTVSQNIETTFVFAKIKYPVSQNSKVYLMVGSTDLEIETKLPQPVNGRTTYKNSDKGTGLGIGIQFHETKSAAYTVDYISYIDEDNFDGCSSDIKMESLNLGILWYF